MLNPSKQTPSLCTHLFHHSCQCWNYSLNSIFPVTKNRSATLCSSLHIVKPLTFPTAFQFREKKTVRGANTWSVGRPTHLWYTVFSQKLLLQLHWVDRIQYKNLHIHITYQNKGNSCRMWHQEFYYDFTCNLTKSFWAHASHNQFALISDIKNWTQNQH